MSERSSSRRASHPVARPILGPKTPSTKVQSSPAKADLRALIAELGRLKVRFDRTGHAAREKLALLSRLRDAQMARRGLLRSYHDLLLFLRAFPDNQQILEESERQLAAFRARVENYKAAARDPDGATLMDSGIAATPVNNVFTYRFVSTMARVHPGQLEIDWDEYEESETADLAPVLAAVASWHENDAIEADDFDLKAWLRLSRARGDATSLDALLRLLSTSGLSRELQRTLYESAGVPVRWTLAEYEASRTGRRVPCGRVFFQQGPALGRTSDLRADLARPAPPLKPISEATGREYVRAITEVLGSRCRELFPLIGSSPEEVYFCEPGRGVRIVVYGSLPEIRLPLEANTGLMLVRNGVPIGYGLGAMLFDRCEIAINVFPEYRSGESSFIFERVAHLFAAHYGARVLLIRPYQIGEDNREALESGSFWFYYKLGFRSVKLRVRALAEEENARIAADRSYRSPITTLKKLARSDIFFHLEADRMDGYRELSAPRVGQAVTTFIANEFAGDRRKAEQESVRRVARALGISDLRRWSADEVTGFRRMAPMLACIPDLDHWSARDKRLLARIVRAKGSRRERDYVLLASRHARFRDAVGRLAGLTVSSPPG